MSNTIQDSNAILVSIFGIKLFFLYMIANCICLMFLITEALGKNTLADRR